MRLETYVCDACKREFGNGSHINVKSGQVCVSYINPNGEWRSAAINAKCREYHFCNCQCMAEWLAPKVSETLAKVSAPVIPDAKEVVC
jgi:hypothetical protein